MIYKFSVLNDENRTKIFYLTADNENQLYRSILSTYGITKDRVTIMAEYEADGWNRVLLVKEHLKEEKHSNKVMEKSKEVWSKLTKKGEPWKTDFIKKYNFKEIPINGDQDVPELVKKYKKVKVYWESGPTRGSKVYYACVK